jgi:RNA polymerase sigma-70 factor (ECF subfamily)
MAESEMGSNSAAGEPDDLELLHRAQKGEWEAFETLVNRLEPRVYQLAFRIVRQQQDAEDVTQQTFLSVMENLDKFREEAAVSTWVLRIATNHALQILRKRRGVKMVALEQPVDAGEGYATMPMPEFIAQWKENPEDLAQRSEVKQVLHDALDELDPKYGIVFVLRDIEGYSTQETAELLDLSVSNVKVRLLRARLQLRERLTQQFGDEAHRILAPAIHE